jgi:hypothetical protein
MNVARSRSCWLIAAVGLAVSLSSTDASGQNLAIRRTVIGGSGAYPSGVYNSGSFPGSLIVDGNKVEDTNSPISYWLGREGIVNEHVTLDLGDVREIDEVRLFNTHNRQFNDRGTDEFVLWGAMEVDGANQLINPVAILSSNLSPTTGQANITANSFTTANGLSPNSQARYLKFEALTSTYGNNLVGLNEIEIYDNGFVNPNRAVGKPVIDGSGAYPTNTFLTGTFPASNVTGDTSSETPGDFWLGREGVANEYFTVDLQEVMSVAEIRLRNTHNRQFDDRGTHEFRIWAADAVDGSNQLINPHVILEGELPNNAGLVGAPETTFTSANGLNPRNARYLRFEALSAHYDGNNVGLNEIEVFNTERHTASPRPHEGNLAARKPVIDGSGSWDGVGVCVGQPFNLGVHPAARVTDLSQADANTGRSSYWLGRENCSNEYFTIDLQQIYDLDEIVLKNTHNTQHNDRGTGEFVIYGSTEVDGANQLINPIPIVVGELARTAGQILIAGESFAVDDGVPAVRYLKFQALTYLSSATNGGAGLNEIQVYGTAIPEPSTVATMLIGLGCVGLYARKRRAA